MSTENLKLLRAFPSLIRTEVRAAISHLPEDKYLERTDWFEVIVSGERLSIPYRTHYDPSCIGLSQLEGIQKEILETLLTRHADGLVRQRYLERIIRLDRVWIPPFVVRLAGEYVIEILNLIWENQAFLDRSVYADFVNANPDFLSRTEQQIMSYWDCYHRSVARNEYAGFRLLGFFKSLANTVT